MTRYVDISMEFRDQIDGHIHRHPQEDLPVYCGHKCTAFDITIKSHQGTYYETSSHVFRDGRDVCQTALEDFFMPVSIVKPTGKDGITAQQLEAAGQHVQPGDALLVHCPDKSRYFNRQAVGWMIDRSVVLLGGDLPLYDTGFVNPTGMFLDLFAAQIPIIANLEHLEQIDVDRAQLVVLPLKISGIGNVPCRAVVIIDQ